MKTYEDGWSDGYHAGLKDGWKHYERLRRQRRKKRDTKTYSELKRKQNQKYYYANREKILLRRKELEYEQTMKRKKLIEKYGIDRKKN